MTNDYIIPTKESPVFTANCDFFGSIEGIYKQHIIDNSIADTFGINFMGAVNDLHEWLVENKDVVNDYPKAKFTISLRDGSIDKYEYAKEVKVYSISSAKAKKLLF